LNEETGHGCSHFSLDQEVFGMKIKVFGSIDTMKQKLLSSHSLHPLGVYWTFLKIFYFLRSHLCVGSYFRLQILTSFPGKHRKANRCLQSKDESFLVGNNADSALTLPLE